jgi:hypothetical protein
MRPSASRPVDDVVGIAKVQLNADTEALAWLRRSIEANRNFPLAFPSRNSARTGT